MNDPFSGSAILKICRRPAICISPQATVREAVRVMTTNEVGAVAVVERESLVGILTERDLMVKIVDRDLDPNEVTVEDAMETRVHSIGPDTSRSQAAHVMLSGHCRHLPVMSETGEILGMLSIRHLYREQLHRLRGQMDSLESYMAADGPGG